MNISVQEQLNQTVPDGSYAWAVYKGVAIGPSDDDLKERLNSAQDAVRRKFSLNNYKEDEHIARTRRAFKVCGLDPARYRPAQEALLRRTLNNKEISFINAAVDVNNLLSIRHRLAMGIYDADNIKGNAEIKIGSAEETYEAINGRCMDTENRIMIRDEAGPFGSPMVDSLRTAVGHETENVLHVIYLCGSDDKNITEDNQMSILCVLGGSTEGYSIVP